MPADRSDAEASRPPWSPLVRSSRDAVIEYYDACHVDYRMVWRSHRNLAIHYGYFDDRNQSHEAGLANMNRAMACRAGVEPGDRVLDAGCGVGGSAIWLAETLDARICGVNIQPLHLEIARREVARRGLGGKIRLVESDYCDTGLPDASFDIVWALESLCHSDSKERFLSEAARLLRPGGRLVVGDFFQFKQDLLPDEEGRMRRWLDGWALPQLAEVVAFGHGIEEAGLEDVRFEDITPHVMPSSWRLFFASLIAMPVAKGLEWLRLRTPRQNANVTACFFQHVTIRRRLWGYGIFTATKPGRPLARQGD